MGEGEFGKLELFCCLFFFFLLPTLSGTYFSYCLDMHLNVGCFYLVPSWTSCNLVANQMEPMAACNSREKVANR